MSHVPVPSVTRSAARGSSGTPPSGGEREKDEGVAHTADISRGLIAPGAPDAAPALVTVPSRARRDAPARGAAIFTAVLLAAACAMEWDVAWRHAQGPDQRWGDVAGVSLAGLVVASGFVAIAVAEARRRMRAGTWVAARGDAVTLVALAGLVRALLFVGAPAFHRGPAVTIHGFVLATGPVALAATVAFTGMLARELTGRVWAATTLNLAAAAIGVAVAVTAPWMVRAAAMLLRAPGAGALDTSWWAVAVPLYPLAAAVCVDLCGAWFAPGRAQRSTWYALLTGACAAVPAAAFATHWASVGVAREVMERSGHATGRGAVAAPPVAPEVTAYVAGALVAVALVGPVAAWCGQRVAEWARRPRTR